MNSEKEDEYNLEKSKDYFNEYLNGLKLQLTKYKAMELSMIEGERKKFIINRKRKIGVEIQLTELGIGIVDDKIGIKNLREEYQSLMKRKREGLYVEDLIKTVIYEIKKLQDEEKEKSEKLREITRDEIQKIGNHGFPSKESFEKREKLKQQLKDIEKIIIGDEFPTLLGLKALQMFPIKKTIPKENIYHYEKKQKKFEKKGNKEGRLLSYINQLEKRLRNLETEKQLLDAERLRLEQQLHSLRNEIDRLRDTNGRKSPIYRLMQIAPANIKNLFIEIYEKILEIMEIMLNTHNLREQSLEEIKPYFSNLLEEINALREKIQKINNE
ncbi:MAG: hypothetical protein ACFFBF_15050 [Promethearchaeota archaeon]